MKFIKRLKARRAVILAAKCVESSYIPDLVHDHDPDDLFHLRDAVKALRAIESM